jgi:hypothetical protein
MSHRATPTIAHQERIAPIAHIMFIAHIAPIWRIALMWRIAHIAHKFRIWRTGGVSRRVRIIYPAADAAGSP